MKTNDVEEIGAEEIGVETNSVETNGAEEIRNPVKAIRAKCLDCCGGSSNEVKLCPATDCPLYAFRFGRNPYRTVREMTDEQRAAAAERLRLAREKRNAG